MEPNHFAVTQQQSKLVTQTFRDSNLRTRLLAQISSLRREWPQANPQICIRSDKLFVELELDSQPYSFKLYNQSISFHIVCRKSYPLFPPRVYLKTGIFQPFINDNRDLLSQILSQQWHHSFTLTRIVNHIPAFLHKLVQESMNPIIVQKTGYYHLGQTFSVAEIKLFKPLEVYQAFTLESDKISMCCYGLSDTHMFIFQPDKQPDLQGSKLRIPDFSTLTLQRYLQTQAISQIKLNKQDNQITMIFKSHRQKKTVLEPVSLKLHARIVNMKGFLRKLLRTVTKFQAINIDYEFGKQQEEELVGLLKEVKVAQGNLARYLNKQTIGDLNQQYQNVVEYLSGQDNPIYLIYLNKIARLFLRQDVKLVSEIKVPKT